ncbi:hypothetical protein AS180_08260 [Priestia veravalensis]|uniref:Group-specific protein n=1 Tax=Priestia veravalensis TaxID=1414648 RepID=A0A0V8JMY3_9BACI|nr:MULTISPECIES: hypothetical protein [Priestia]KSU88414.1 hypothetical protein AS180_08260 [Priestia veravalensis]SCC15289.1 hypothetical protein GA0061087_101483 [Priestia flexa]
MIKKVCIALILCFIGIHSHVAMGEQPKVEVFQLDTGKVIRVADKTEVVQKEVEKSIASITGIYKKVNPLPKTGYLVKIPLDPAVQVQQKGLDVLASEAVVVFSPNEQPVLMLYDNENKIYFFEFTYDISTLRKELEL